LIQILEIDGRGDDAREGPPFVVDAALEHDGGAALGAGHQRLTQE
jgi:hypothetical protein